MYILYIIIDISPKNQRKYHITKYTDQMYNFKFFQKSIKMHAKNFFDNFYPFSKLATADWILKRSGFSERKLYWESKNANGQGQTRLLFRL